MGALLIHLTGGRIETHFHVFGSLAFLSFYRDWRVLVPATIVVAADHFLRGLFWPQSVYGVLTASEWRWLEHAGWVLFEDTFLFIAIRHSIGEMRGIAERTAEIESLNEGLEAHVANRTAQLVAANHELEREVAERKLAEAELAEQRSFLRQVIDLNPNFVFAKDREGRFTLVNQAIADAYGTSVESLLGKTDADFNPNEEEVESFRRNDLEVMNTLKEKFIPEEVITDARGQCPLAANHQAPHRLARWHGSSGARHRCRHYGPQTSGEGAAPERGEVPSNRREYPRGLLDNRTPGQQADLYQPGIRRGMGQDLRQSFRDVAHVARHRPPGRPRAFDRGR